MSRAPELLARLDGAEPVTLDMTLTITIDPAVSSKVDEILGRLEEDLG